MAFQRISTIKSTEIVKGFNAKLVHGEKLTLSYLDIEENSILTEHKHFHEQITQVLEGKLELCINGETEILEPGMLAIIPSNVLHSGKALSFCRVLDVFTPVREDYKNL
jgi:quercetin dioxygenase-like cupin family protein